MSNKQETVDRYRDEFLRGRTQQAIEAFNNKPVEKQYSSIMTWRYNRRKAEKRSADPSLPIRELSRKVLSGSGFDHEQLSSIEEALTELSLAIEERRTQLRLREIEDLEKDRIAIEQRLRDLRANFSE